MSRQLRLLVAAGCAAVTALLVTCTGAMALSGAAPVLAKGSTALGPAQGEQSVVLTLEPPSRRRADRRWQPAAGGGRLSS